MLASAGEVAGLPALSAPLIRGDELVGQIECGPRLAGAFNESDREILTTIGRQAALAIHNAALTSELERRLTVTNEQARELAASRARLKRPKDDESSAIYTTASSCSSSRWLLASVWPAIEFGLSRTKWTIS